MTAWRHFIEKMPGVLGLKDGHAFSLGHTATLPTCEARREGEERVVRGTAGVATRRVICRKDAADAYAWWEASAELASTEAKTIAAGVITLTSATAPIVMVTVDTQAAAATDDLDTISGGAAGQVVVLTAADSARTVVVKDGTGNLRTAGDHSMDHAQDTTTLIRMGSAWFEIARANNNT